MRTLDEHTLKGYGKLLRVLSHKVSLDDPLVVERHILGLQVKNKYKNNLLTAYSVYCKANGIEWDRPSRLRNEPFPIKVPTEERIDLVVSCATPTYAVVFSMSKYGLRPDEIGKITLRDLDLGQRTLAVRTSKAANTGSYSWVISSKLALGSDYRVRVTSLAVPTGGSAATDTSDVNFSLTNLS